MCEQTKTIKYQRLKTRLFILDICVSFLVVVIFQMFFSFPAAYFFENSAGNFYLACACYVALFYFFIHLTGMPLHFFGSFTVEHRFGLSNQSIKAWMIDEAKSAALSLLFYVSGGLVFYFILRTFPDIWWAILAVIWFFFSCFMARMLPVLIIPLFYKYIPLEEGQLKNMIMGLGKQAGIDLSDVCKIDLSRKTKKANAALVGLGSTKKVVLADTLMSSFSEEEIGTVVAHEFAHCKFNHIWKLILISACITALSFWLLSAIVGNIAVMLGASGASDIGILPAIMLCMMCFGLLVMPLQNFISRCLEREADRFALEIMKDPGAFISAMERLAEMNLAERDPGLIKKIMLYDHPPIAERIRMAQNFQAKH
ncbi:MAG TPA: M48 family metallopeptidase [Candidatus Omnitrophota bacterium]|nr:M48 family metallopeptidase [Candidatus Omnitrophota bacterium]HPS20197.1 M48 family metallopeptidase [Candidatus Omnitrophota bacterium]